MPVELPIDYQDTYDNPPISVTEIADFGGVPLTVLAEQGNKLHVVQLDITLGSIKAEVGGYEGSWA